MYEEDVLIPATTGRGEEENMETPKLVRVQRFDSIKLDDTYFTEEGYLRDCPIVTRCGIFEYLNEDGTTRRELRLPEDVFAEESLASYEGKPIIVTHAAGYVYTGNVGEEGIGTMLSKGFRDGDSVRVRLVIHNMDAIKNGPRELSLGYNLRLDETPGEWEGQPYDAIQRDIVVNHLAVVDEARAGETARLNIDAEDTKNSDEGGNEIMSETRKDGALSPDELTAAVEAFKQRRAERMNASDTGAAEAAAAAEVAEEVAEQVAEKTTGDTGEEKQDAVQMVKDRRDRRDSDGDPEDLNGAMGIIAQQDEDIDTLLGVIDVLKSNETVTDSEEQQDGEEEAADGAEDCNTDEGEGGEAKNDRADSAAEFRELLRVVRVGDRLNMDGLESMSVKNAKKAVLKKLKPNLRLDGKSSAYVSAAFDMAVAEMKTRKDTNYQRSQMMTRKDSKPTKSIGSAADARQRMIDKRMKKEDK